MFSLLSINSIKSMASATYENKNDYLHVYAIYDINKVWQGKMKNLLI